MVGVAGFLPSIPVPTSGQMVEGCCKNDVSLSLYPFFLAGCLPIRSCADEGRTQFPALNVNYGKDCLKVSDAESGEVSDVESDEVESS